MRVTLFRDLPTEGWPSMERYADELAAALAGLGCDARAFTAARPWPGLRGRPGALANYAWRSLVYPAVAGRQQAHVNHILDHTYAHLLGSLEARRTVVTCHDLAPLAQSQHGHGLAWRLWRQSFRAMQSAAHIITPSSFTRDELLQHTPYPGDKITPIAYGIAEVFHRSVPEEAKRAIRRRAQSENRALLLHVGSCEPRKNLESLIRAAAALDDFRPIVAQVGGHFTPAQRELIRSLGLDERVHEVGPVLGPELRAWYQAADALIFPSLYEGFGLPVLEAMASGTPVVCANRASLPEVAGDAALLADPLDPPALADAVRRVLTDGELRQQLIDRGRTRSRDFTWERAARRTMDVYTSVFQRLQ
jgi:glycosyltransferase involved in cell wall biosynthesis